MSQITATQAAYCISEWQQEYPNVDVSQVQHWTRYGVRRPMCIDPDTHDARPLTPNEIKRGARHLTRRQQQHEYMDRLDAIDDLHRRLVESERKTAARNTERNRRAMAQVAASVGH